MAKTSTISLSAYVSGDGIVGTTYNPPQSPLTNPAAPEGIPTAASLSAGANTVAVPAGALRALIVPVLNSANSKTVRTVPGDTGVTFTADPVLLPLAAGVTTLYFQSTGAEVLQIVWG